MNIATLKNRLPNYTTFFLIFAIICVFELVLFVLLMSGTVRIGCEGIRIDSDGNIYVGLSEEIRIFDRSGHLLRTISPKTSKGYVFEIDGDKLLVDCASTSYVMDLNGVVLELKPYPQLPWTMKTPKAITVNEAVYHIDCSNFFYRVTIEDHSEKTVAVQMPTFDLLVEAAFIVTQVTGFAFVVILLRKLLTPSKEELVRTGDGSLS